MIWLEIAANVFTILCVILAARNNVHTWWTGLVGCVLFGWLFYSSQLYGDAALQVFFFAAGVYGWYAWLHSPTNRYLQRPVTTVSSGMLCLFAGLAVLGTGLYGLALKTYTDAYMPFVDSFVLMTSVLAQFLLMYRKVETWPTWLIVNTVAVPLFFSRGLYLTAGIYTFFWFNALYGWYIWRKESDL